MYSVIFKELTLSDLRRILHSETWIHILYYDDNYNPPVMIKEVSVSEESGCFCTEEYDEDYFGDIDTYHNSLDEIIFDNETGNSIYLSLSKDKILFSELNDPELERLLNVRKIS